MCVKCRLFRGQNWRDAEILTLIRIWADEGIQEYHDNRVINLSRPKYFSVNEKISLYRSTLYQSTLYRTLFDPV